MQQYGHICKLFVSILTILIFLTACNKSKEISRNPVDYKYIEAYQYNTTIYVMVDGIPCPITQTHYIPESYKIKYYIVYEDKTTKEKWIEVSKEEFEKCKQIICY